MLERLRAELERREGGPVEHIETHISHVLLTPLHAYKIKKPLQLPFVDFSSLEARRRYCEEELRLNRRLAPDLYLAVVAVHGSAQAPRLDGDGPAIEYAVQMRRFPDDALLSERLRRGTLEPAHLERLAQRLADFHGHAPVAAPDSGYGTSKAIAGAAWRALEGIEATGHAADCAAVRRWLHVEQARMAPYWSARLASGRVREAHGDLHLANAIVLGDEVTAFDCIEFDPALRWIDVLADIAFLAMDLMAHGRRDLAFGFVDAYLASSGDYEGLPVLRYYLVYRALVRAQVSLIREAQSKDAGAGTQPSAADYLALAAALAAGGDARLLVTHGLPGSGKSYVSRQLLAQAGAIRIRSDVERKRLVGLDALERSVRQDIYGAADTERTYERLLTLAAAALDGGWPTIVDAAFGRRAQRERFRALAHDRRVPYTVLECTASPGVLRERVEARTARGDDPSEADLAVLERLAKVREPIDASEQASSITLDTAQPLDAQALARRWLAVPTLDLHPGRSAGN